MLVRSPALLQFSSLWSMMLISSVLRSWTTLFKSFHRTSKSVGRFTRSKNDGYVRASSTSTCGCRRKPKHMIGCNLALQQNQKENQIQRQKKWRPRQRLSLPHPNRQRRQPEPMNCVLSARENTLSSDVKCFAKRLPVKEQRLLPTTSFASPASERVIMHVIVPVLELAAKTIANWLTIVSFTALIACSRQKDWNKTLPLPRRSRPLKIFQLQTRKLLRQLTTAPQVEKRLQRVWKACYKSSN